MILHEKLYKIERSEIKDEQAVFSLRLNDKHPIFRAHFPSQPITPGVCQIQIIRELIEYIKQKPMEVSEMKTAKYLTPIDPTITPLIDVEIKHAMIGNTIKVHASISCENNIFTKMSLLCINQ